ncbi:protein translocase subunit SecF [bacterium endosymbiont of Pedicinus badii]|uniref:protein translocase subunit SecF n=1 Tax=bacterium endosymbiont of Pedicinus badii TaxID=1719126 RepID=UPI0009BC592B|nr:protein translocase subunit SecF [bacterium endosymbiont of Pedicinus badii]OQM34283.1 hypothetical protein AOQ89_00065 [bacterium endosymbiont of Pedicinus badii]
MNTNLFLKKNFYLLNFFKIRKVFFIFFFILVFLSLLVIINKKLTFGIDFTGGIFLEIYSESDFNHKNIKKILEKEFPIKNISTFKNNTMTISIIEKNLQNKQKISQKILKKIKSIENKNFYIKKNEYIGPLIGKNSLNRSILAIIFSIFSVFFYIYVRFELKTAISILYSLLNNITIILGIFAFFKIPIDINTISSFMVIVGYSLNDNIIVSDRIRENFKFYKNCNSKNFIVSIKQVSKRTILTSLTTVFTLMILIIFGSFFLRKFSFLLIFGIFIGTVNSIYVIPFILYKLKLKKQDFKKKFL